MAILIVDPQRHSREILRSFLRQMGIDVIREAETAADAIKILDVEKARIRAVLATDGSRDDEGAELSRTIAGRYELTATLFLLVGSRRRWFARRSLPRVDAQIVKPFRVGSLARTFSRAYHHRVGQRRTVLYVGDALADETPLKKGLKLGAHLPWNQIVRVGNFEELTRHVNAHQGTVGAALIDPVAYQRGKDWLGPFTKTPLARMITLVCLGRTAEAASPLRTYCHLFVEPSASEVNWAEIFTQMAQRARAAWDVEWLGNLFKASLRQHNVAMAKKLGTQMLHLDPRNAEANGFMGDLLASLSQVAEAVDYYRQAVQANPCFPHPYIKLMELLPTEVQAVERCQVAEQAATYCPGHGGTLRKAAQVWQDAGQQEKADALLNRIRSLGGKK